MTDNAYLEKPKELPKDTVRVRAIERGEHGLLIRNPGEVFLFDTAKMRCVPPKVMVVKDEKGDLQKVPIGGPIPEHATLIETPAGTFELPPWVELAPATNASEPDEVASGHKTTFRRDDDVL